MANKMKAKELQQVVKANLIELTEGKVTNGQADNAIKAVSQAIFTALEGGSNVGVTGLGTFELRERGERKGRNPQTGEEITIEARKAVGFKPADGLKSAVKGL